MTTTLTAVRTQRPRVTVTRPPAGAPVEMVRALEGAVLDALGETTQPLDVQFSTCLAEDGRFQFVCRVEGPPAHPFGGEVQWRWWSAILDDPQALRESLSAATAARGASAGSDGGVRLVGLREMRTNDRRDVAMRIVALLVFVGCAAVAQAQSTRSFTPSNPPRAGEETILNARVVSVDTAGSRITVRGVDVKADGGRDETYNVAAPSSSQLHEMKPGTEVLLTLRGTTVVGMKVSVDSGGPGGNVIQGTGPSARAAARARAKTAGAAPRPAVTPAPAAPPVPVAPVTGGVTGPTTGVVGVGGVVRVPVVGTTPGPVSATPFPTPRPVGDPPAVGTPTPVLLPSDRPSPAMTPTPSPAP